MAVLGISVVMFSYRSVLLMLIGTCFQIGGERLWGLVWSLDMDPIRVYAGGGLSSITPT